ncbi:hypothetical protein MUG78_17475 [Gordonia alkaliphila]|uniref:hypothetical protein n=1 Tax=Gordonia alkaliphila TaxID=1053547 RepID=UPI001FF3AFDD|nr:hypothetical protein [Gordonia alkaliphila]MCK0441192.1 hypothetical protein [Gordonia alkaliphila]
MTDSITVNPGAVAGALGDVNGGKAQFDAAFASYSSRVNSLQGSMDGATLGAMLDIQRVLQNIATRVTEAVGQLSRAADNQANEHLGLDGQAGRQISGL